MDNKYEFFEGQSLSKLWWEQGELVTVGRCGVSSIKISMENGQMSVVPWAVVFYEDGRCRKRNLALASGVELDLKKGT